MLFYLPPRVEKVERRLEALALKLQGEHEMAARDYAGAVATFDRALALWPDNREIQASIRTTRAILLGTGFAPRWSAFASRAWVLAPGAPRRAYQSVDETSHNEARDLRAGPVLWRPAGRGAL